VTIGIACPNCRFLIGVPNAKIDMSVSRRTGVLLMPVPCPECRVVIPFGKHADVIVPVLVEGGKRQTNVK
jgi:ssDNA-binding Zn-finger/Zn-ribbon topoisomerase 1